MTTPKGITKRPIDGNSVPGINFSADGMTLAKMLQATLNFLERELRPSYTALWD